MIAVFMVVLGLGRRKLAEFLVRVVVEDQSFVPFGANSQLMCAGRRYVRGCTLRFSVAYILVSMFVGM